MQCNRQICADALHGCAAVRSELIFLCSKTPRGIVIIDDGRLMGQARHNIMLIAQTAIDISAYIC